MKQKTSQTYFLVLTIVIAEAILFAVDVALYYAKGPVLFSGLAVVKDVLALSIAVPIYLLSRRYFRESGAIEKSSPDTGLWLEPTAIFSKGAVFLIVVIVLQAIFTAVLGPESYQIEQVQDKSVLVAATLNAVIKGHFLSLSLIVFISFGLVSLERLILFRRLQTTKTNFLTTFGLFILGSLASLGSYPGEVPNIIAWILLGVGGVMMLSSLFRLSWILPLSRRDKLRSVFLVIVLFIELASLFGPFEGGYALLAYSNMLGIFGIASGIFVGSYLGIAFLSLLFYLPTSEAIEKKSAEVRNLYAMSKFITDVFDEEKIYASVVNYAGESFGVAASVWFDLFIPFSEEAQSKEEKLKEERLFGSKLPTSVWVDTEGKKGYFKTVAQHHISSKAIRSFSEKARFIWTTVLHEKIPVRIDDVLTDRRLNQELSGFSTFTRRLRTQLSQKERGEITSVVSVPLLSRGKVMGLLHVAKDVEFGFVKDDIELITTFADQAAIAIDNSRLIRELIDKKRLEQELSVAQKIQLKLLPEHAIPLRGFDIEGVSYPAYEVGGDYYDFAPLSANGRGEAAGVIIADVSGKGTSAAFYMAEMKGIFQSLCRIYPDDPKSFLVEANAAITKGLDKGSFVSAMYAVISGHDFSVHIANAGHCPPAMVNGEERGKVVKMSGLALGLDKAVGAPLFKKAVSDLRITMNPGDVVVLYTDGVIEAQNKAGDQFGFDGLLETIQAHRSKTASEIKTGIFEAVNAFTADGGAVSDDLTLVIIKRLESEATSKAYAVVT